MQNASSVWKWMVGVVAVVAVGLALGFYLSGSPKSAPSQDSGGASPAADTAAPPPPAPVARPASASGAFTAKGAPEIQIQEQAPTKVIKKTTTTVVAATPPTKPTIPANTTNGSTTSTNGAPPLVPTPQTDVTPATPQPVEPDVTTPAATPPDNTQTQAPPPPPVLATNPPSDTTTTTGTPPPNLAPPDNGSLYRVLVGTTFTNQKNADIFAAALIQRGFMARTSTVTSTNGTIFKVQVGAYRNRLNAEDTVSKLQEKGYPAYIAADR